MEKIDIRPSCITCGKPWMPPEGVNALRMPCTACGGRHLTDRELAEEVCRKANIYSIRPLIQKAISEARSEEREACAGVADAKARALRNEGASVTADVVLDVADRIRVRTP